MEWKFSANAAFFGAQRNRFTRYQPDRTLEQKFALAAQVEGLRGIELRYPVDFGDLALVRRLLAEHDLALSAVNVDLKDAAHFRYGALSARCAQARARAASLLRESMDLAAELDCELITACPLADGYDYPFQVDPIAAWDRFIETVRAAARHRTDVRLLLEYQPSEPHARVMLRDVGRMLYLCQAVGEPNVGANLDVGHALAAGESPAEAAALLARAGRLWYVHSNDNTGEGGDWDMISGTVHFWHWLELLYTLDRLGYDGWFSGDLAAKQIGPAAAFGTNLRMIRRMSAFLERAGREQIAALLAEDGNVAGTFDYLSSFLNPGA